MKKYQYINHYDNYLFSKDILIEIEKQCISQEFKESVMKELEKILEKELWDFVVEIHCKKNVESK